jgi:hypothetical protein
VSDLHNGWKQFVRYTPEVEAEVRRRVPTGLSREETYEAWMAALADVLAELNPDAGEGEIAVATWIPSWGV